MDFTIADIALIPIIVGLVQVIKNTIPTQYKTTAKKAAPWISLGLGIAAGYVYVAPGDVKMAILYGVTMGLVASGFYDGGKAVIDQKTKTG